MNSGTLHLMIVNYLAHFYLAYPEPDLMFGNYIGDGVRGSNFKEFSDAVARGIRFHRFIDTYTDAHEEVLKAKKLFYPSMGFSPFPSTGLRWYCALRSCPRSSPDSGLAPAGSSCALAIVVPTHFDGVIVSKSHRL